MKNKNYKIITIHIVLLLISSTIFNSFSENITNNHSKKTNPVIVWNTLVTELGSKEKLSPPEFARSYALVHISIYDSLLANKISIIQNYKLQ